MTDEARLEALKAIALGVMRRAYAPYSGFLVGAALVDEEGGVSIGCNVENSSYPAGICAERSALSQAVAAGKRRFSLLVIATESTTPTPPCGLCRQALAEFAPDLPIVSVTTTGAEARWGLEQLLPTPFTPASLEHV